MSRRISIVGTDTGVGKTAVTCCLLRHFNARGRAALPFKPAASGFPGEPTDAARLVAAASLPPTAVPEICPLRYDQPLAPGIAEAPDPFLRGARGALGPAFATARDALARLEQTRQPDLVLVEGAGGLHVPMPDGTWLPAWLRELAPDVLVVGRLGLGTINHTHLTVDAIRAAGLTPLGFVLSETTGDPDPSTRHNAEILARATGSPHLGTMPHAATDPDGETGWITEALTEAMA